MAEVVVPMVAVELLAEIVAVHKLRQQVVESVVLVVGTAYIGMAASGVGTAFVVEFGPVVVIGIVVHY